MVHVLDKRLPLAQCWNRFGIEIRELLSQFAHKLSLKPGKHVDYAASWVLKWAAATAV